MKLDLDELERRAARSLDLTYGMDEQSRTARLWSQKGIEAMRLAVAKAQADA